MNPLLIRFQSVLTTLEAGNQARSQFKRLLVDKRNDVRIVTRRKSPEADLRLGHPKRTIGASGLAAALLVLAFVGLPELGTPEVLAKKEQVVIQVDDIPETRQIHRPPPPPRPPVPIETDDVDVPDDVTIESTDLNFDDVNLDLPPPPGAFAQTESLEGGGDRILGGRRQTGHYQAGTAFVSRSGQAVRHPGDHPRSRAHWNGRQSSAGGGDPREEDLPQRGPIGSPAVRILACQAE